MPHRVIKWTFSCGHEIKQALAQVWPTDQHRVTNKTSTLKCPECTETENQAQSLAREQDELKQKKAEAARGHEKNAIILYQTQAAFITKQIEDDGGDQGFRDECTKILTKCKLLWARIVRIAE